MKTRFISAAILAAALAACSGAEEEVKEPPIRPIKLITVEEASNLYPVTYPAVIEAAQTSDLTFQVNGLLQELTVVEGQPIEQGGLIAKLDQRDFQNNYNSAKAQFDNAESEYKRASRLSEQNAISRSVLEQRRSARDIAKAQLDTAEKALNDTELRAPFGGQIAQVHVENFQNVRAQQSIVTLQTVGVVEAVIDVPARLLAFVPQLTPLETLVILDAAAGVKIPADFKEASAQADPTSQTYRVHFTFEPPEGLLILPGMTGTVETVFSYDGDEFDQGVIIPAASIFSEASDTFVWVVDAEAMTVSKRKVTVADPRLEERIRVTEGLSQGDVIAGAGAAYLHEGMRVRAWAPGP